MKVYFIGIGGAGLSPLAQLAQDAGYEVSGSDQVQSLGVQALVDRDIRVNVCEQLGDELKSFFEGVGVEGSLVVYSAGVPESNGEIKMATGLGIKTVKRHVLINQVLEDKELQMIAVSGTHGKTTTTAMVVWCFQQLGIPVSYSIGTNLSWGASAAYEPGSEYFVYEADEFDQNMLKFDPEYTVLPSLDYDHPDTYATEEEYMEAFKQLVEKTGSGLLAHADVLSKLGINLSDIEPDLDGLEDLIGHHNRLNAALVSDLMFGIFEKDVASVLNQFPGTERRQEKLAENLYTDYAHHPVEIAVTTHAFREFAAKDQKLVIVYQPHQNVRQHEVKDGYTDCFELADTVYWVPTYLSREDDALEILTTEELTKNLTNKDSIEIVELNNELIDKIKAHIENSDMVVLFGAGDIDAWGRESLV